MLHKHIINIALMSLFASIAMATSFAQAEEFTVTQTDKTFKMGGTKVEKLTIKVGTRSNF